MKQEKIKFLSAGKKSSSNIQNTIIKKKMTLPSTKQLQHYKFIQDKTEMDLRSYPNDILKEIVKHRGISTSGNKDKLVKMILKLRDIIEEEDEELKEHVEHPNFEEITNEQLYDLLIIRSLKVSGNKKEKIEILKNYLDDI